MKWTSPSRWQYERTPETKDVIVPVAMTRICGAMMPPPSSSNSSYTAAAALDEDTSNTAATVPPSPTGDNIRSLTLMKLSGGQPASIAITIVPPSALVAPLLIAEPDDMSRWICPYQCGAGITLRCLCQTSQVIKV